MKRYSFLFAFLILLFFALASNAQTFNRKAVEKNNRIAIEKAYQASVRMWGFDTIKQQRTSSQFSGVVVSAEGHILTVAHAVKPGNTYKVFFPNGQELIAVALGRMGFKEIDNRPDVAMMKIISKDTWPFAEIGWSSSLRKNEPCLSISYPETLDQKQPTVRFGYISIPMTQWGFVQSTCKMEPGDSGGPLFDYLGRVVALHSRIDRSEAVNFEVPVDMYRKYWTALNSIEDYERLPEKEDDYINDPLKNQLIAIPELAELEKQFSKTERKFIGTSIHIKSTIKGQVQQGMGTVFLLNNATVNSGTKTGTYVVAKSSIIGNDATVDLDNKQSIHATIINRDIVNDLVLLRLPISANTGISFKSLEDTASIKFNEVGKFLLSPLPAQASRTSILSSTEIMLPKRFGSPYFGANANFINQQIILTSIIPGSPADSAKLQLQDQVTGINGTPISQPAQYGGEIMKYAPGDTITIQGIRNGTAYNLSVALKQMPARGNHPADRFDGGKSFRLDNFKRVFAHDALIKANECGGPVFDADGKFYGINIARFSRTSTLAMPVGIVYDFIKLSL